MPIEGVAIEPPKAQIFTLIVFPGLDSILAYSKVPLTHLGTITACNHTESNGSPSSSSLAYFTALSIFREPDKRPPI